MTKRGAEEMLRDAREAQKEVAIATQKKVQADTAYEKIKEELAEEGGVWTLVARGPHLSVGDRFFTSKKDAEAAVKNLKKTFNSMHTYHTRKATYSDTYEILRRGLSSPDDKLFDTCQVIIVYQKTNKDNIAAYIPVPPTVSLDYTDIEPLLHKYGRKASLVGSFVYKSPMYTREETKEEVLEALEKRIK